MTVGIRALSRRGGDWQETESARVTDRNHNMTIERMREAVEARLVLLVPEASEPPTRLHRSMRHSLLAPGKRVRALFTLLAARHWGGREAAALIPACAIEMVHASSLILDDLPAMDDSTLRRGQPANHRVFGEGTAILAAIGLMNRAFAVVAEDRELDPATRVAIVDSLSRAIGSEGLVAGQEQDLNGQSELVTAAAIEDMHGRKTGALFAAAAEIGAVIANVDTERRAAARTAGYRLGIAFQTFDDLLDCYATEDSALKDIGKDHGKPTIVALLGPEPALAAATNHLETAIGEFGAEVPDTGLTWFVRSISNGFLQRLDRLQTEHADGLS